MPLGVEHTKGRKALTIIPGIPKPLMPLGIEHNPNGAFQIAFGLFLNL